MVKETRHSNNDGDLFINHEDQRVYVLLKTKLGWFCMEIDGASPWGGLKRTKNEAVDGLEPLGFKMDMKEGKRWASDE